MFLRYPVLNILNLSFTIVIYCEPILFPSLFMEKNFNYWGNNDNDRKKGKRIGAKLLR